MDYSKIINEIIELLNENLIEDQHLNCPVPKKKVKYKKNHLFSLLFLLYFNRNRMYHLKIQKKLLVYIDYL